MIWVTMLLNGKRVSFSVQNSDGLYSLDFLTSVIKSLDAIYEINVTKDYIILTKNDVAYRDGPKLLTDDDFGERRINNIEAYDWDGNLVWNIGDIVGDIGGPFYGCKVITKEMLESSSNIVLPESLASHDLLICHKDRRYIIDLSNNELVCILHAIR